MTALPYQAPRFRRRAAPGASLPEVSSGQLTTEDVQPTHEGLSELFAAETAPESFDGSFTQLVERGWQSDCAGDSIHSEFFGDDLGFQNLLMKGRGNIWNRMKLLMELLSRDLNFEAFHRWLSLARNRLVGAHVI